MAGDFESFLRYLDSKNWLGLGMRSDQPLSLGFQISNFLTKRLINIYIIKNL